MDDIRYLKHSEINKEMWDACVINSTNGLIYARSWYLDAMSPGWEALVHKDYIAVMPLTVCKKMGIQYLAQPAFSQQLGIIGPIDFPDDVVQKFISVATSKFSFLEINLNFKNEYVSGEEKCNLVLDLGKTFHQIKSGFRKDLVSKAVKANLLMEETDDYKKALEFLRKSYSKNLPHVKDRHFKNLSEICEYLKKNSNLIVKKVFNQKGDLLATGLFFRDEKRIYYMMAASLPEGRRLNANAFLLHEIIKEFSGSKYIFDFEGSSVPSINFFFRKFNPVEENYRFVRINNLPPVIKKIKLIVDKAKGFK
ncbi:MAG: hypothetical protein ABI208_08655 [Ginsengibacter sp.]